MEATLEEARMKNCKQQATLDFPKNVSWTAKDATGRPWAKACFESRLTEVATYSNPWQ